jgi:hypothetical protein
MSELRHSDDGDDPNSIHSWPIGSNVCCAEGTLAFSRSAQKGKGFGLVTTRDVAKDEVSWCCGEIGFNCVFSSHLKYVYVVSISGRNILSFGRRFWAHGIKTIGRVLLLGQTVIIVEFGLLKSPHLLKVLFPMNQ